MINWLDKSDRQSRFYIGEIQSDEPISIEDAVDFLFAFMQEKILGVGNAINFDVLMFEVNCDTGRLIAGASTDLGWKSNRTDGCSIRVQKVQDYWYDLIDANVAADQFSQLIKKRVVEIACLFKEHVMSALGELRAKSDGKAIKFMVFGSNSGEIVTSETLS